MGVYMPPRPEPEEIEEIEPVIEPVGPPPPPMITQITPLRDVVFESRRVVPKGVDLSLNQFDLSTPVEADEGNLLAGSWAGQGSGKDFWRQIDSGDSFLDEDTACLLREVFNPNLSDRREDGDRFIPPGASFSHVEKLRNLIKAEMEVQNRRKELFFSSQFVVGDAGPLFPASWTDALETARGRQPCKAFGELLPEGAWLQEAQSKADVDQVLRVTAPVFERSTEDGTKFRIYKSGSLEVRTIEEYSKAEVVGAVFSVRSAVPSDDRTIRDGEKIVKATEYVRFSSQGVEGEKYDYFVVMESEQEHVVVTQKLENGETTWEENPVDLEDRSSVARVIRAVECRIPRTRASFLDVKRFEAKEGASITDGRIYAQQIFIQAVGGVSQMIRSNNIKVKSLEADRNH